MRRLNGDRREGVAKGRDLQRVFHVYDSSKEVLFDIGVGCEIWI